MPIRIFCHDSAVIRSRGHNNNAVPNPSSETARTIASHFSLRFMGSALTSQANRAGDRRHDNENVLYSLTTQVQRLTVLYCDKVPRLAVSGYSSGARFIRV